MHLEKLTVDHVEDFYRWVSNELAVKYSLSAFSPDRDKTWIKAYIEDLIKNQRSWDQVIVQNEERIGYCGISNISKKNQSAEYYILIGDNQFWGKGIGTQAGAQVLQYSFDTLELNRVWLTVSSTNLRAVASYNKLGYSTEGIMREAAFRDDKFHDKIVMGMLRKEWENK